MDVPAGIKLIQLKIIAMTKSKFFPMYFLASLMGVFLLYSGCEKEEFDPEKGPATLEIVAVDFISKNSAYFIADIYGEMDGVTQTGFCWSLTDPPVTDDNIIIFEPEPGLLLYPVRNLQSGSTYYVRAWYTHDEVVYYSETLSFSPTAPVTDNDDNTYGIVKIGDQLWLDSNLKVKTFNNGDPIADGTGRGNYAGMQTPRFYFNYKDIADNSNTYGHLYTWHVATDNRGICPAGWRVPDIADWETLILHLDALGEKYDDAENVVQELSPIAGGFLRSTGTIEQGTGLWYAPNTGANNITTMSVFPSGFRDPTGGWDGLGYNAAFWSYTEKNVDNAIMIYSHHFNPGIHANAFSKSSGYAIRCVRDVQ
jgi:uncharacterized protein (TIGR02145 family)